MLMGGGGSFSAGGPGKGRYIIQNSTYLTSGYEISCKQDIFLFLRDVHTVIYTRFE